MEIEEREGLTGTYYEMRCLDEGLRDVDVTTSCSVDLTDMMYYRLKAARLEREI